MTLRRAGRSRGRAALARDRSVRESARRASAALEVACRYGAWVNVLHSTTRRSIPRGGRTNEGRQPIAASQFESGTWRKGHYGPQPEGVRPSIDKKAGKLQNYRSVYPSVDGRGQPGAERRRAADQPCVVQACLFEPRSFPRVGPSPSSSGRRVAASQLFCNLLPDLASARHSLSRAE